MPHKRDRFPGAVGRPSGSRPEPAPTIVNARPTRKLTRPSPRPRLPSHLSQADAESRPMAFQCTIVTPEQQLLDESARQAIIPAHDGLIGVLTDRAPLLVKLGVGKLEVD